LTLHTDRSFGARLLPWRPSSPRPLVRHPVSLARQRAGTTLLVFLTICFALYSYSTRDEAIRRSAVAFIEEATQGGVEVTVGRASFRMFSGITLHNVQVLVPFDRRLGPAEQSPTLRTIFKASSLELIHNPWHLLLGDLRVERVVAVEPTITLTHNTETGLRNWQLLWAPEVQRRPPGSHFRPVVALRKATAVVISVDAAGVATSIEEELDADARPDPRSDAAYSIDVRRRSPPYERNQVLFDPAHRRVVNTPFVEAKTIRLQLPAYAQAFFDKIALEGEVQLRELLYDRAADENRHMQIKLRRVQCRLPIGLLAAHRPADKAVDDEVHPELGAAFDDAHALHMTDVRGTVELRAGRVDVDIKGRLDDAQCSVTGSFTQVDAGLRELGVDVHFRGKAVPTPEGWVREGLLANPDLPADLRSFLVDYDPHGHFDLDLHFVRPAGQDAALRLTGDVVARGVTGTFKDFVYPVTDLEGTVRFRPGHVQIKGLRGRHGDAVIAVEADIRRTNDYADINVELRGESVPLEPDLFEALSERYQSVLTRFRPSGKALIRVRLHRPDGPGSAAKPPWNVSVSADLSGVQAHLSPGARLLENIEGRVDIVADELRLTDLRGEYGDASVHLTGHALLDGSESPPFELQIEADGVRLDESLGAALPAEGRGAFAQFQPRGFVDLVGTLSRRNDGQGLVWDIDTRVYEASIRHASFPYAIDDVSGRITIRPDSLSIIQVAGAHGESRIAAHGDVRRTDGGFVADMAFDGRRIALQPDLYEALPPPLRNVWDMFEPTGHVRVRVGSHVTSDDGQVVPRHRVEIDLIDAGLRFRDVPLKLTSVSGKVIVTDRRVEIVSLRGSLGEATLGVSGVIDLAEPGHRGTLTITAEKMPFDRTLLDALPGRLGDFLSRLKPTGRFALRLDALRFATDAEGRTQWWFDGGLTLDDVSADLGFELQHCHGALSVDGTIGTTGELELAAAVRLEQAVAAGWHLQNVRTNLSVDRETRAILVDDASAELYGGEAAGSAIIDMAAGSARVPFRASITVRDVQLSEYLEIHGKPTPAEEQTAGAQGSLSGNLVLRRRAGRNQLREGTGEVLVSRAQVWKLPVLFAIFQVLNLTPDENVFHDGRLKFYVSGDTLTFQKIDLQGKAVSLVGGGTMNIRTDALDVTLLAGSPVRVRVPLLTEILEGASREIMEVRVTGTLGEPTIRPQPLKSLTAALKTLFPEAPRSEAHRPVSVPRR